MKEISKKSFIIFIPHLIVGVFFLLYGLFSFYQYYRSSNLLYYYMALYLNIPIGVIIIVFTVIGGIFDSRISNKGRKITRKGIILFITSLIVGMIFLIYGLYFYFYGYKTMNLIRYYSLAVYQIIPIGVIIIFLTAIGGIIDYIMSKKGIKISKMTQYRKQTIVGYIGILIVGVIILAYGMNLYDIGGLGEGGGLILLVFGTVFVPITVIGGIYRASKRVSRDIIIIVIPSLILGIIFLIIGFSASVDFIREMSYEPSVSQTYVAQKVAFFITPGAIIILVSVIGGFIGGIYVYIQSHREQG